MLGLGLDYGLGFSSDIRLREDPQLRLSHLATTLLNSGPGFLGQTLDLSQSGRDM